MACARHISAPVSLILTVVLALMSACEPEDDLDGDDAAAEACMDADAGVQARFALEPGDLELSSWEPVYEIPCRIDAVSAGEAEATTELTCTDADEVEHAVMLATPVPAGRSVDWAAGDEVQMSVEWLEDVDTIQLFDLTVGLRAADGTLLFAGVGDLFDEDGHGYVPNALTYPDVIAPLSLERDGDACPADDANPEGSRPLEVSYTLAGAGLSLLGNAEGTFEAAGRTYAVLQERAETSSSGHAGSALQLVVVAVR